MNVKKHHALNELLKLYKSQSDPRLARRLHGIYLAAKGLTCIQVTEITGAKRRTVQQWVRRYNKDGIAGLPDKPRSGQPTKLPRHREQAFCMRIEAGPTIADGISVLNGAAIQRLLEREFGVIYSFRGVYDLLYRLGYSCLCPRPQHEKADPKAQEEFKKTSLKRWSRSNRNIRAKK
ncbi:MAG: winged helix-turn-helix domain-containing protein [Sedimentisphaerales bacterium]|nr:winged helix-turn-helix domain-containing protein [Sedimentisphaerales bacterium]